MAVGTIVFMTGQGSTLSPRSALWRLTTELVKRLIEWTDLLGVITLLVQYLLDISNTFFSVVLNTHKHVVTGTVCIGIDIHEVDTEVT